MSINQLAFLFTLGVLVHNAEEALWLPKWSRTAGRWHRPVTAFEFRMAVTVLSLVLVSALVAMNYAGPGSVAAHLFAGYVLAMVLNALFPHALVSIASRSYMPGSATALLLNAPLGAELIHRMLDESQVQIGTLCWVAPVVTFCLIISIPILFAVAARLQRTFM